MNLNQATQASDFWLFQIQSTVLMCVYNNSNNKYNYIFFIYFQNVFLVQI